MAADLTHAQELAERLEEKGAVQTWIETPVTVRSYANIAIIKYWGKEKKKKEMVPATSSISLTLENMYTETTFVAATDGCYC